MKGHRHDQNLNARALWGTKGPLSMKMQYEAALPRLTINTKLQSPPIETYPPSTSASNPPPLTHRSLTEAQTGETHLSFASCLLSWPSCNKGSSLCKGPLRPVVSGPLLAGNTINEHTNSMGLLRLYSASFDFQTPWPWWECSDTPTGPWDLKDPCLDLPLRLFQKYLVFDRDVLHLCFERYAMANHPALAWTWPQERAFADETWRHPQLPLLPYHAKFSAPGEDLYSERHN